MVVHNVAVVALVALMGLGCRSSSERAAEALTPRGIEPTGAAGGPARGGLPNAPETGAISRNVEFARASEQPLLFDLYSPTARPLGVVVWVHGGAWRAGSRENVDLLPLVSLGWAVASVDYRLSPVARFPAQVHDIKAAVRYLRAHASELNIPTEPVVIAGSSAGGHLAALVGVSNEHPELEGQVGDQLSTSSRVQAIVDLYGASNFETILAQSTEYGRSVRAPALDLLLGPLEQRAAGLSRLASPVAHVDPRDPPLFLVHGSADPQMPPEQSRELEAEYRAKGLIVEFSIIEGAKHGGPEFTRPEMMSKIDAFLRRELKLGAAPAR
jgi:acetyl esterase/lipase